MHNLTDELHGIKRGKLSFIKLILTMPVVALLYVTDIEEESKIFL